MEVLYSTKVTCLQCGHGFQTSRVRSSSKKASRTDTDFCNYFKEEQKETFRQKISEQWMATGEEMIAANLELPEEMRQSAN